MNYVIGGGPVALIAAETLSLSGERVKVIFPRTYQVHFYSPRKPESVKICDRRHGLLGGTARIWESQCTRFSESAYKNFQFASHVSFQTYLENSSYIENKLGIDKWPNESTLPIWESGGLGISIKPVFSVIPTPKTWDKYFSSLFLCDLIETEEDFLCEIDFEESTTLIFQSGKKIALDQGDLVYMAMGTMGILNVLKRSKLLNHIEINYPLDHPTFELGRISGIIPLSFRQLFTAFDSGFRMKNKFLVKENQEIGIFEFREKWDEGFASLAKRLVNFYFRKRNRPPKYHPELWLWIQMAQLDQNRNPIPLSQCQGTWSASESDVKQLGALVEAVLEFLDSLGLSVENALEVPNVEEYIQLSQEAFHPSGVFTQEAVQVLRQWGIIPLGACILGNSSWNNPTLPAMAVTRAMILESFSRSSFKPI